MVVVASGVAAVFIKVAIVAVVDIKAVVEMQATAVDITALHSVK